MYKTVLISAGHGGEDPGAVSGKYKEAALAVGMRDRVAYTLREKGVPVVIDGSDGVNDPLNRAIALCGKVDGPAVELHFNAGPPSACGIEALSKIQGKRLSQHLCAALSKVTQSHVRGNEMGWKPTDSGQHHRLGFCEAGGVILEVCFISNLFDMAAYTQNKQPAAEAVAHVLALHAGWTGKGTGEM